MTTDSEPAVENLEALVARRQSAQRSLDAATAGLRKCRQKRGADAYKRGWYFQEQIDKWQLAVDRLNAQIANLGPPAID